MQLPYIAKMRFLKWTVELGFPKRQKKVYNSTVTCRRVPAQCYLAQLQLCEVCGMPVPAHDARGCIGALRRRIAELEWQLDQALQAGGITKVRGRGRQYEFHVTLGGQRISFREAAEILGMPPKILYERVYYRLSRSRTRPAVVCGVDLDGLDLGRAKPWAIRTSNRSSE